MVETLDRPVEQTPASAGESSRLAPLRSSPSSLTSAALLVRARLGTAALVCEVVVLKLKRGVDDRMPGERGLDVRECVQLWRVVHTRGLENATVREHDWYKLLDAQVLTLDVTV